MNKATDIILKLYKNESITKKEANILLDAIWGGDYCYNCRHRNKSYPTSYPYRFDQAYWEYRPEEQPKWTITSNSDNTNVE